MTQRHAEYNLAQPWRRRPRELGRGDDLSAVESAYRRLRRRREQIPEEQLREAKQQLEGIRGMYQQAGYDLYPVRTRATDIYGDFTDILMEHEPMPEAGAEFKAAPVAHLMNKTGGRRTTHAMPQVGEEGLVGRYHDNLIFEDGSGYDPTTRGGKIYPPESPYLKGDIRRLVEALEERGSDRRFYGDADALRRLVQVRSSRRPGVDFWESRIPSLADAVDEYKEQSGGDDKAQIRRLEYRGATPAVAGYRSQRGRGRLG